MNKVIKRNNEHYTEFTDSGFWKAYHSLKLKSSSGPDGFANLPLKYATKELSAVFADLFQLSISTCVLPDSWRTTRITPLPKKSSMAASPKLRCPSKFLSR